MAQQGGGRLPYGLLWVFFLTLMFVGAGLFVAGEPLWGALLFSVPLASALGLSGIYYILERNRGRPRA